MLRFISQVAIKTFGHWAFPLHPSAERQSTRIPQAEFVPVYANHSVVYILSSHNTPSRTHLLHSLSGTDLLHGSGLHMAPSSGCFITCRQLIPEHDMRILLQHRVESIKYRVNRVLARGQNELSTAITLISILEQRHILLHLGQLVRFVVDGDALMQEEQ
jgi:hypothetical protein